MKNSCTVLRGLITVHQRSSDWHACLTGEPSCWGCGRTPAIAIGQLLMAHEDRFTVLPGRKPFRPSTRKALDALGCVFAILCVLTGVVSVPVVTWHGTHGGALDAPAWAFWMGAVALVSGVVASWLFYRVSPRKFYRLDK